VTRSSNCSRSSRKRGTSTSLWGYAVSASNARFSTDLDIVVAPDSKADFVEFIEHRGFEETDSHAKESLLVSLGVRIIIGFIVLAVASGVCSPSF